jgi:hypothetical protein
LIRVLSAFYKMLTYLPRLLYSLVLLFFRNVNERVRVNLPLWRMEVETSEHVHLAVKAFKWIILPASLFHIATNILFLGDNALIFVFCAQTVFLYSSFVPDLPSTFRREKNKATESFRGTRNTPSFCLRH